MLSIERLEPSQIDELAPLWAKLNAHHRDDAPLFRDAHSARSWDERRAELLAKAPPPYLLVIAARDESGSVVAYAVGSVSPGDRGELRGELESLFVSSSLRSAGLGRRLAEAALS